MATHTKPYQVAYAYRCVGSPGRNQVSHRGTGLTACDALEYLKYNLDEVMSVLLDFKQARFESVED